MLSGRDSGLEQSICCPERGLDQYEGIYFWLTQPVWDTTFSRIPDIFCEGIKSSASLLHDFLTPTLVLTYQPRDFPKL